MTTSLQPSPLSTRAIAGYAEQVGAHHDIYGSDGGADLRKLLDALGGKVVVARSFIAEEALTVRERGDFVVHLPPMTSDRRDRFTVAHELGHYFLHYLQPQLSGPQSFGRGSRNPAETQANVFAASLLMPTEHFRSAFADLGSDWWAVANRFGVSPAAAKVRAQVLGLS